jgi:hypothetical protein
MPELSTHPMPSKARIIATAFIDVGIDLLLPTAIFALLAPTHLSALLRLTMGGYFVAAKAGAGHFSSGEGSAEHISFRRAFITGTVIAAMATAVTIIAKTAALSDMRAIACGAVVLALIQGTCLFRTHRRLDGFALLVLVELAATIILTSVSNTPRLILIRPSFYTAIAGLYVLSTVWAERPLVMRVTKPMAAEGDPVRAEAFERAGRESIRFRRAEQSMTAGLGVVLLGEACLRVLSVWSHPQSDVIVSSLWSQVPAIGLLVVYFVVVKLIFVPRVSREVDAFMPQGPVSSRT